MGSFATGVAVVTTSWKNRRYGMTMNSLTSVSLEPCMLLVCPKRGSATGEAIKLRGAFAVNVLAESQREEAERFIGRFDDRFRDSVAVDNELGLPLLAGSVATISCAVAAVYPGGDHEMILGEVMSCECAPDVDPLVFHRGRFGTFTTAARLGAGGAAR